MLTYSFEETVANAAILRLHTAALWAEVSLVPTKLVQHSLTIRK